MLPIVTGDRQVVKRTLFLCPDYVLGLRLFQVARPGVLEGRGKKNLNTPFEYSSNSIHKGSTSGCLIQPLLKT